MFVSNFTEFMKPTEAQMKFHGRPGNSEALKSRRIAYYWGKEELSCGRNFHSQCFANLEANGISQMESQVTISLTSQSKLGYAKYNMRNDGRANRTVMSMYKANIAALAGIAYKMIRRNITTNGNLAVN